MKGFCWHLHVGSSMILSSYTFEPRANITLLLSSRKLSLVCACLFIFLGAHTTSCHIGYTPGSWLLLACLSLFIFCKCQQWIHNLKKLFSFIPLCARHSLVSYVWPGVYLLKKAFLRTHQNLASFILLFIFSKFWKG